MEQSHEIISEREKLRKIKQGQKVYMEEFTKDIITKYYDEILHFCVYQLHNIDNAYDITQDTFLRFIKNMDKLVYKNIKGYLLTIARNLCLDYWKACKRENLEDFDVDIDTDTVNEDKAYEQVENGMVLSEILAKLPPEQREVVVLRYYNHMDLSAIAKIQEVSLSTVKSRLRLGVQRMKQYIKWG